MLRRSLLFVVVTGEEKGLLGSRYFAAHPTVDAKHMIADLNMDMFLPIYPMRLLTVYGLGESDLGVGCAQGRGVLKVECRTIPRRSATCSCGAISTTSFAAAFRRS